MFGVMFEHWEMFAINQQIILTELDGPGCQRNVGVGNGGVLCFPPQTWMSKDSAQIKNQYIANRS